jgi:hypothetical protein
MAPLTPAALRRLSGLISDVVVPDCRFSLVPAGGFARRAGIFCSGMERTSSCPSGRRSRIPSKARFPASDGIKVMGIRTVLSAAKTKDSGVHSTAIPDVLPRMQKRQFQKMTTTQGKARHSR